MSQSDPRPAASVTEGAPGPVLASGRSAVVYDVGDGRVLRRYTEPGASCEREARIMQWAAEQGVPVPAVYSAAGTDLVMERLDGGTLLDDLGRRPWKLFAHARLLARLQRQINELTAPEWLDGPTWIAAAAAPVPPGDRVLHLDLHPMNVMLTSRGPVIIDWPNASRGAADFDAAYSYLIMATFETESLRDRIGQRILVSTFARTRGRRAAFAMLPAAAARRLADPNVTAGERANIDRLLQRRSRSPGR